MVGGCGKEQAKVVEDTPSGSKRKENPGSSFNAQIRVHHSEPQSSTQKPDDSNAQILPSPQPTSLVDPSHASAADISHNPQNPSKIPIRPPKIRKLSNQIPNTDDKTSSPQTTIHDTSSAAVSETIPSTAPVGGAVIPATPTSHTSAAVSETIPSTAPAGGAVIPATPTSAAHTAKNRRRSASKASRPQPQIIKPLSADSEIEFAIRHLRSVDPLLSPLIETHPPPQFESHHTPFLALTKSILYQQLAYKAGTSIYTRFVALCGGEDSVRPDTVLALTSHQLKQIGVSGRKATYLYDLANKYKSGILSDDTVVKMDDRSLFAMLSMVKGIGSWSVHMFMIFSLHRPDVLPVSDLGVRKGVQLLYGLEDLPRPSQMEQLCEKWRPYRSVGAWYMWRFVEGKGGPTAGSAVALDGNLVQPLQQIDPQQDGGQHQHQLQFVEPVNGIGNLGACIWNQ